MTNAVDHVSRRMNQKQENERLKQLVSQLNNRNLATRIGLASQNRVDFVEIARIIRCEADNNYTHVFIENQDKKIISKTLKEFEELLSDHGFIRLHQSHIVNSAYIQSYHKNDGGYIKMTDNAMIPVSRTRKNEIIGLIRKNASI